jgi:DNA-binding NarL/FixJ family response regulator
MRLRIVIADDNPEFLERFVSVLKAEFDIVGTAKDGLAALELAVRLQPDVAVLDIEMPGLNGIEVTRKLSRNHPSIAIVICSVNMEPDVVAAAREAGARGYVFKSRVTSDLVSAVKAAASGTFFTSLH